MEKARLIYENLLKTQHDLSDFIMEGQAKIDFANDSMRMQNSLNSGWGQKANYVLWCKETFPANIRIDWEFKPAADYGLCMLFFAAKGIDGSDLFDHSLNRRTGDYSQYHSGDINTFHISYYRRKEMEERQFHTCNLRKSFGFHLVAQGADPIPGVEDVHGFYRLSLTKYKNKIEFSVNELPLLQFADDGSTYGDYLGNGKIGLRQLAPLIAEYRNIRVYEL